MIVVVPITDDFWLLVAVMVMLPVDPGAVNKPLAVIVPPLANQFTGELAPVAAHCDVPLGATDDGLQLTVIAGSAVAMEGLLPPPHPVHERGMMHSRPANVIERPGNPFFIPHRRRLWSERAFSENRKFQAFERWGVVAPHERTTKLGAGNPGTCQAKVSLLRSAETHQRRQRFLFRSALPDQPSQLHGNLAYRT